MQSITYTPLEITSEFEVLKNIIGILVLVLAAVFLIKIYARLYRNN